MSGNGSFRAPPIEDLQPHFQQYSIEAFVAVGGMGAVYRATQLSVDRPVALKILPPEMAGDVAFQDRFVQEAKAMAKLSHRNLVQIYDFGETNGIFWMIQEWVQGRTIFDVMHEEERLSPSEAAALVAQACEGLGYAHKQGIVHRDVKPANMMVDNDGMLKLMDFGLARIQAAEGKTARGKAQFATEEYAAPELWDPSVVLDHRVDIFALGVLLYEALTGKRPTGTFRMPSELRPSLDKRFDEIVVRAMQRNPENRFSSCADLLSALRKVVTSPPKVKLQTSGKPTTATLRLKPSRRPQPAAQKPPPALAIAGSPPVAQLEKKKSKKNSKGLIMVLGALVLLGLVAGAVKVLSGGKDKEAAPPNSAGGRSGDTGTTNNSSNPRAESTQARIDRQHREREARLAEARKNGNSGNSRPTPEPAPEPGPEPNPEPPPPVGVDQLLKDLDDELRAKAGAPFESYATARAELEEKYFEECTKEENKAVGAGDLDAVLFWQAEAWTIGTRGDVPASDAGAPVRAVELRKAWRSRLDPLKAALAPIQSAYVEKCEELAEAADSDEAKGKLRERAKKVTHFKHFVALCAGKAPPFAKLPASDDGVEALASGKVSIGGSLEALDVHLKSGRIMRLPEGTKGFNGNYYLMVPGPLNWQSAKEWCEVRGGHLATLGSPEEIAWFGTTIGSGGTPVFLGGRQEGEQWRWITGEPWPENPRWASGQPNNSEGNQNVIGWKNDGLNDMSEGPTAFVIEWEKNDLKPDLLAAIEGLLPGEMVLVYRSTRKRLDELKEAGETTGMATVIKNYGRSLVRDEKALTKARKIKSARAVRAIKDEMLVLLGEVSGGDSPPEPARPKQSLVLIEKGAPSPQCRYDRKHWKRKGKALLTEGEDREDGIYPWLKTAPSIGRGDFRIQLDMTCGRIGATGLKLVLGETYLHLDGENGRIELGANGASIKEVRGTNLGALAKARVPAEFVIARTGKQLEVLVNGKSGLKATVHDREIGPLTIRAGKARLELLRLAVEGGLEPAPKMQRLATVGSTGWNKGMVQLVPTGNEGLTALFIAWSYNDGGNELWAQRSRDGGAKWDQDYEVIDENTFEVGMTSFAAASNERNDEIYAVVATGKANHRLFLLKGRNGGRNWSSRPQEITAMAKKPGWNVRLASQGLVVVRNRAKEGRIVLPMHAGNEEAGLHMLVSDNGGRDWKVIGPVCEKSGGDAEILEDDQGTLWAAVGFRNGPAEHGFRMVVSSADGGDTWSEPVVSKMPDAGHRGSLAFGVDADKKPVWFYASAKPVRNEDGDKFLTHLTLFFSRDQGKNWEELRRVHYGSWSFPTVVPVGPNRCGVCYLAAGSSNGREQIRFVDADGLWGQ